MRVYVLVRSIFKLGVRSCHAGCKHCVSLIVNCQFLIMHYELSII